LERFKAYGEAELKIGKERVMACVSDEGILEIGVLSYDEMKVGLLLVIIGVGWVLNGEEE
jgi:hypothetical protein